MMSVSMDKAVDNAINDGAVLAEVGRRPFTGNEKDIDTS